MCSSIPTSSSSTPWLDSTATDQLCIPVASSSVHFLHTPDQFFNTLLTRISGAEKRVVLSALYLGTGEREQQLVNELRDALSRNDEQKTDFRVSLLFDFFRGTRGTAQGQSTTTMLAPLVAAHGDRVQVCLFHTPQMRGLVKQLLPERLNEVIGVQHMKFFIFDDSILISGANLSDQYFVNRQDRYLLIEHCPMLADFFCALFDIVAAHSFHLDANGQPEFPIANSALHPETGSIEDIQRQISSAIAHFLAEFKDRINGEQQKIQQTPHQQAIQDTFVVPFLQMGLFGVNHELDMLSRLFGSQDDQLECTLMTAYFNLYETYADLILQKRAFPLNLVFGSPKSNGFHGASGPSGHVPALYQHNFLEFVRRFMASSADQNDENRNKSIKFLEWDRSGWTFHAKGLWVDCKQSGRAATIVGSSNYGFRSAHRDLEAQLLLVTDNEALKSRMAEERASLLAHTEPVLDLDTFLLRRGPLIPHWVKLFARLFRHFF